MVACTCYRVLLHCYSWGSPGSVNSGACGAAMTPTDTPTSEEWRTLPAYSTNYEVSSLGRFRSLRKRRRILKQYPKHGYLYVCIHGGAKGHTLRAHRLVALAFIGEPPTDLHEIHHKDGDKQNNRPDNLEWVDHHTNVLHSFRLGLRNENGVNNNMARLTDSKVRAIRRMHAAGGWSHQTLADHYGVGSTTVGQVVNGRSWSHVE